jgi:hypothetical protein
MLTNTTCQKRGNLCRSQATTAALSWCSTSPTFRFSTPPRSLAGDDRCGVSLRRNSFEQNDHGFLPLLGDDGLLDLAALNVENRIGGLALRVDNLTLPIIGNNSPPVHFRQKYFGIERGLPA